MVYIPGTSYTVTTADDEAFGGGSLVAEISDGTGLSLREAIALANMNIVSGPDEIGFDPMLALSTIQLTQGSPLVISDRVIIDATGPGGAPLGIVVSGDVAGNDTLLPGTRITDVNGGNLGDNVRVIEIVNDTIEIIGLTVTGSTESGIHLSGNSVLMLESATVSGNTGPNGGGIYINGYGSPNGHLISNSTISDNRAGTYGGGIFGYGAEGDGATITNSTIGGNMAGSGGGVGIRTSNFTILNSNVDGNAASGFGGGIDLYSGFLFGQSSLVVEQSSVTGNSAADVGGGIYSDGPTRIATSLIADNMAATFVGGIVSVGPSFVIDSSVISGNTAANGGGIYNLGTLTVLNSTISGNTASGIAGGLANGNGSAEIVNSTISGNTASNGGGLYNVFGATRLTNTTITSNVATVDGGGIAGGQPQAGNSIIQGNSAPNGPDLSATITPQGPNLIGGTFDDDNGTVINDVPTASVFRDTQDVNGVVGGALGDNGGTVVGAPNGMQATIPTVALVPFQNTPFDPGFVPPSPAVGTGDPAAPIALDEGRVDRDLDGDGMIAGVVGEIGDLETEQRGDGFPRLRVPVDFVAGALDLGATQAAELGDNGLDPDQPKIVATDDLFYFNERDFEILPRLDVFANDVVALNGDPVNGAGDGAPGDLIAESAFDDSETQGLVDFDEATDTFTYDPAGAFGDLDDGEVVTDSFTYTIIDQSTGEETTATVTIEIEGGPFLPGDEPVILSPRDDELTLRAPIPPLDRNLPQTVDILANDRLAPPTAEVSVFVQTPGTDGEVELIPMEAPPGVDPRDLPIQDRLKASYTPGPGYTAVGRDDVYRDSFTYEITVFGPDGEVIGGNAGVSVNIPGANDPVVALDSQVVVQEGQSAFFRPPVVDPDVGDEVVIVQTTQPEAGTVEIANGLAQLLFFEAGDGLLPGDESRTMTVDYIATDGLTTDTGSVEIVVIPAVETTSVGPGGSATLEPSDTAQLVTGRAASSSVSIAAALDEVTLAPGPDGYVVTPDEGEPIELRGIATVMFEDVTLTRDTSAEVQTLYRFYETFLGRGGDPLGLGHYKDLIDQGVSFDAIADAMAASPELAGSLADPGSNQDFVEALYLRAFGRECDAAGCAHWVGRLASGEIDRGDVGEAFAASPELADDLGFLLDSGLFIA